jgi:glycosyltransferase involved in cell wall biosynthesis
MLENRTRLGLDHVVRYEGWVSKERLAELLQQADLGIVAQKPSPYSHLVHTNKMFDYWIAGLPVLASRLDATAALFGEHEIAYYDGNNPAELAEQMVSLAHDPARRRELARKGREAWIRVGWHVQRDRYLDVFRRLLGDRFPVADGQ